MHAKAGVAKRTYIPNVYVDSKIYVSTEDKTTYNFKMEGVQHNLLTTSYVFMRILEPNKKKESHLCPYYKLTILAS